MIHFFLSITALGQKLSTATTTARSSALGALRGLTIIGMILSGHIAHGGVLPAWMHHAQVPPPGHQFDPGIPGITWVDLVFPMFLFAMGMAFPFALRRRIKNGVPNLSIVLQAFKRWGWVFFFALFYQHLIPQYMTATPGATEQLLAWGAAFLILGMAFEPYEGGIKKDPATLSYYYVTAGLSTFLFMGFFLLLDLYRAWGWQWLTDTGRNPMIAYVAPWLLIWPILKLSGLSVWVESMNGNALMGLLRGVLITGLSMAATVGLTRWGWRWKT